MTSRELVRKTLDYENPPRLARSFGEADIVRATAAVRTYATDWARVGGERWERRDEWGNLWARLESTSKGEVVKGVLNSLDELGTYEFPDFSNPDEYDNVRREREAHPDHWLLGNMPGFTFNIANKLRKLENYLMDLLLEPERIQAMHDRIDRCIGDMIRNYAAAGVDGVFFPEDWGTQQQTMISPALWREEFFPRTRSHCALAHSLGIRVFMHSCGKIGAIVPGLAEAGIDCLQFDAPELHGIENLAACQDRGRITFWCPVDIQKTLQTRDETLIRSRARLLVDKLWRGRGGFIAGYYTDNASIGLDPSVQEWACDEFVRYGAQPAEVR